jgi:hypothetical protein
VDPLATASESLGLARSLWGFLEYLRTVRGADVIAAYFDEDANRLHGSDHIQVVRHPDDRADVWWFEASGPDDYVFIRYPLVESAAHELVGQVAGSANPTARFWRWVAPTPPGAIAGGPWINVLVPFVVVGYRPKALVAHFSATKR